MTSRDRKSAPREEANLCLERDLERESELRGIAAIQHLRCPYCLIKRDLVGCVHGLRLHADSAVFRKLVKAEFSAASASDREFCNNAMRCL